MRKIDEIIIHCTATEQGKYVSVADIDRWHRARGWKCVGYHYIIYLDGSVHSGRPISQVGAHCRGHNAHSIGVCYVGGLVNGRPSDTRTQEQKDALRTLVKQLRIKYPHVMVYGHNELAAKDCPCFNVAAEYRHAHS